jgi:uncharacterized membrane protein YjgN (DUF898 family)
MSYPHNDPNQPTGYPQPYYYQPYVAPPADHPRAALALILGILGVVLCGVVAPFAWVFGRRAMTEIDTSGGVTGGRGMAQAGFILGVIGSVLLALQVVFVAIWLISFFTIFTSVPTN